METDRTAWSDVSLTIVSEWVAVPNRPATVGGRIVAIDLRLGARPDGDGENFSLQVWEITCVTMHD